MTLLFITEEEARDPASSLLIQRFSMANYARNERLSERPLSLPSANPLVLPEPLPAAEGSATLTLPLRPSPLGVHNAPIRHGSDVIAIVNDSNQLSARLHSLRSSPDGMKELVSTLSSTESHGSAFTGMNGVQVLQNLLSQRQTVAQLVNTGAFRENTSAFTREVAALQAHNVELASRIS